MIKSSFDKEHLKLLSVNQPTRFSDYHKSEQGHVNKKEEANAFFRHAATACARC